MNIFLNGADRSSGDNSSFTCDVNNNNSFFNLKDNEKLEVFPVRFSQLNDYKTINQYNNIFLIEFYFAGATTPNELAPVSLTEGYYDIYSFATALETAMDLYLNSTTVPDGDGQFLTTVVVNPDTSTYQIQVRNTDYFSVVGNIIKLNFALPDTYRTEVVIEEALNDSMAQFCGFNYDTYTGIQLTDGTIGLRWNSIKPVDFVYQPEIIIKTNLVRNNLENNPQGLRPSQILFSISSNTAKGQYLQFINTSTLFKTECIPVFSTIEITFEDTQGRRILFLTPCQLVLGFNKIRTTDNIKIIEEQFKQTQQLIEINTMGNYLSSLQK